MLAKPAVRQTPILREITHLNQTRKKKGFMEKPTEERIEELYDMMQRILTTATGERNEQGNE